jgi:putative SOS response-associated peptidase YedK
MCGRFASTQPSQVIREAFHAYLGKAEARPSFNVAPSQQARVVRRHPASGENSLDDLAWGLIPHWTKDLKTAPKPINARGETVASSSMFAVALMSRRALIPADAFYEWQAQPDKTKKPFAISRRDQKPMAFGGIWESWQAETGKLIRTFTIITTSANALMRPIHDRMPVILGQEDWATWLQGTVQEIMPLIRPADDSILEAWPVSTRVNSPRNDDPTLLKDLSTPDR